MDFDSALFVVHVEPAENYDYDKFVRGARYYRTFGEPAMNNLPFARKCIRSVGNCADMFEHVSTVADRFPISECRSPVSVLCTRDEPLSRSVFARRFVISRHSLYLRHVIGSFTAGRAANRNGDGADV